jgi:hypothetical protein
MERTTLFESDLTEDRLPGPLEREENAHRVALDPDVDADDDDEELDADDDEDEDLDD